MWRWQLSDRCAPRSSRPLDLENQRGASPRSASPAPLGSRLADSTGRREVTAPASGRTARAALGRGSRGDFSAASSGPSCSAVGRPGPRCRLSLCGGNPSGSVCGFGGEVGQCWPDRRALPVCCLRPRFIPAVWLLGGESESGPGWASSGPGDWLPVGPNEPTTEFTPVFPPGQRGKPFTRLGKSLLSSSLLTARSDFQGSFSVLGPPPPTSALWKGSYLIAPNSSRIF